MISPKIRAYVAFRFLAEITLVPFIRSIRVFTYKESNGRAGPKAAGGLS